MPTSSSPSPPDADDHLVSIVVPVYRGEKHLAALTKEIAHLVGSQETPDGNRYRVVELVLVHDCGPDDSARIIRDLDQEWSWVHPVWLSRNFGQHAATLAGIVRTEAEWVVTLDEDGQHDPADIGSLLDAALATSSSLVYAQPVNPAPHPPLRRLTSVGAKRLVRLMSGGADATMFHSFRLMLGDVARQAAAGVGPGVYLDIALSWVIDKPALAPVTLRDEGERVSGYRWRTLMSHFWRMVLTSGTRGLRMVSIAGFFLALVGFGFAVALVIQRLVSGVPVRGWTSMVVITLICSGAILFALGAIAEYIGVTVGAALGRPAFLTTVDPATGPLGRRRADAD